jgi:hypothetical protein
VARSSVDERSPEQETTLKPIAAGRPSPTLSQNHLTLEDTFTAPAFWLFNAAQLPGKSLHAGILLHHLANSQKSHRIALSNSAAALIGLDRGAKYRALHWLEDAQMITVRRRQGQPPIVTILDVASDANDKN